MLLTSNDRSKVIVNHVDHLIWIHVYTKYIYEDLFAYTMKIYA